MSRRWLWALALSLAPAARGEELSCTFDGGAVQVARRDGEAGGWRWSAPGPLATAAGLPAGAPFFFMSARIPEGAAEGAVAGSEVPPAGDWWAAAVHRRPSLVVLIELGSDAVRVLSVAIAPDAGGRRAATYSRQVGGPGGLSVEQLTGSCRPAPR